jgi:hypothetical protein
MKNIMLGIMFGLAFGIIDVLVMIPMKFENRQKRWEAMGSAFIERFMIGFLVPNVDLGIHPALTGGMLGLMLSLPSAIITKAYGPILGIGVVGGILIGFLSTVFG